MTPEIRCQFSVLTASLFSPHLEIEYNRAFRRFSETPHTETPHTETIQPCYWSRNRDVYTVPSLSARTCRFAGGGSPDGAIHACLYPVGVR
jgi:hypothetical protein